MNFSLSANMSGFCSDSHKCYVAIPDKHFNELHNIKIYACVPAIATIIINKNAMIN